MKFALDSHELYPVFTLYLALDYEDGTRDFSEAEITDLKRVVAEFAAWQRKIANRFGRNDGPDMSIFTIDE